MSLLTKYIVLCYVHHVGCICCFGHVGRLDPMDGCLNLCTFEKAHSYLLRREHLL